MSKSSRGTLPFGWLSPTTRYLFRSRCVCRLHPREAHVLGRLGEWTTKMYRMTEESCTFMFYTGAPRDICAWLFTPCLLRQFPLSALFPPFLSASFSLSLLPMNPPPPPPPNANPSPLCKGVHTAESKGVYRLGWGFVTLWKWLINWSDCKSSCYFQRRIILLNQE